LLNPLQDSILGLQQNVEEGLILSISDEASSTRTCDSLFTHVHSMYFAFSGCVPLSWLPHKRLLSEHRLLLTNAVMGPAQPDCSVGYEVIFGTSQVLSACRNEARVLLPRISVPTLFLSFLEKLYAMLEIHPESEVCIGSRCLAALVECPSSGGLTTTETLSPFSSAFLLILSSCK
jgi:hypothetical protein